MKDERTMILNMLKEGKISVEEAEALLEVLGEEDADASGGFAAADQPGGASPGAAAGDTRARGPTVIRMQGDSDGDLDDDLDDSGAAGSAGRSRAESSSAGRRRKGFNIDLDLDLGGLRETLREAMKSVSETVRGVTDGLADLDIGAEIFRSMGKVRAEDSQETSEAAGDAAGLSISNKWGDVRVTGGAAETISVRAEATAWGGTDADAAAELDRLQVGLERDGDIWRVRSGLEDEATAHVRVDYTIRVPRRFDVSVSTAAGDIWLEELEGRQEAATLAGDVSLSDIGSDPAAPQAIRTKSGDLVGGALTGDISLSTLSGDVEINGFTGLLRVSTKSGDVNVRDGAGSIQAKTLSGDVNAMLTSLGAEPVTVTSVSGDVALEIPEGSAVDLSARSTSGDVDASLDLEIEKRGDHVIAGKANGGGLPVTVTTVSGDISVGEG